MTARHYYRNSEGDMEAVPTVLRWAYVLSEKANEGEAGTWEAVVDDPDMTLDFVGHRRWIVYEDESDDDNQVVVDGITQGVRIAHMGGEVTNPDGRVWIVEVADLNALWQYRVMTGSDSQFAEQTDVERILQIANSEEMGYFDDLSFVPASNTVTMDEMNGRGQFTGQIADAAAQATGKNYWIGSVGNETDGTDIFLWYDRDASTAYESPLSLSNDPSDLNMAAVNAGTAITYPLGADTELRRDYARQYSGAYGEFQDGAKYIPDTENPYDPGITLSGRDIAYPAPEIKTRAKMKARLLRVLRDHATPDEVIKTTITLPANKVTQLRRGMRVAFKATHLPAYVDFRYLRVLSAQPKPIGRKYEVALELQGPGSEGPASCSTILGATETATLDNEPSGSAVTSATVSDSVTIAPSGDGPFVIFGAAGVIGAGPPRPNNVGAGSGYTTLHSDRVTSEEPAGGTIYKTGASAGSQAVNFVYDTGFNGVSRIGIVAAAFESSATAPLQDVESLYNSSGPWEITLPGPATVGNLLILAAVVREQDEVFAAGSINPPGWTLLASATTTDSWSIGGTGPEWPVALYARCSDGTETTIELPFLGREAFLSLSEWEL